MVLGVCDCFGPLEERAAGFLAGEPGAFGVSVRLNHCLSSLALPPARLRFSVLAPLPAGRSLGRVVRCKASTVRIVWQLARVAEAH